MIKEYYSPTIVIIPHFNSKILMGIIFDEKDIEMAESSRTKRYVFIIEFTLLICLLVGSILYTYLDLKAIKEDEKVSNNVYFEGAVVSAYCNDNIGGGVVLIQIDSSNFSDYYVYNKAIALKIHNGYAVMPDGLYHLIEIQKSKEEVYIIVNRDSCHNIYYCFFEDTIIEPMSFGHGRVPQHYLDIFDDIIYDNPGGADVS